MKGSKQSAASRTKGEYTRQNIKAAIARIRAGRTKHVNPGRKLSIASVAEEAKISRALIHNNYPDLAEQILNHANRSARIQRDQKSKLIKELEGKNRILRHEIAEQRELNRMLASQAASMAVEIERLQAFEKNPKKVVPLHQKG